MVAFDDGISAEEVHEDLLRRAQVLTERSTVHAAGGDVATAVVCAWAADVSMVQAVAWEQMVAVTHSPQAPLFALGESLIDALGALPSNLPDVPFADELIRRMREPVLATVDPQLRATLDQRLPSTAHLAGLPAPSAADLHRVGRARLAGEPKRRFITARRAAARSQMDDARMARVRGRIPEAIRAAYAADICTLEAYLVESALAVGDEDLLTVLIRWEFATAALRTLGGVPDDFTGAITAVRSTLVACLGTGDGGRLAQTWTSAD